MESWKTHTCTHTHTLTHTPACMCGRMNEKQQRGGWLALTQNKQAKHKSAVPCSQQHRLPYAVVCSRGSSYVVVRVLWLMKYTLPCGS